MLGGAETPRKKAITLYQLSPSFNTFPYTGLTSTLLSSMKIMGVVIGVVNIFPIAQPSLLLFYDDITVH